MNNWVNIFVKLLTKQNYLQARAQKKIKFQTLKGYLNTYFLSQKLYNTKTVKQKKLPVNGI